MTHVPFLFLKEEKHEMWYSLFYVMKARGQYP